MPVCTQCACRPPQQLHPLSICSPPCTFPTMQAQHDSGFLYDSSINEHWSGDGKWPTSKDGGSRLWPYTMDAGKELLNHTTRRLL